MNFRTYTVVCRADRPEPTEPTGLSDVIHDDEVVYFAAEDGVSNQALALGADPESWDDDTDPEGPTETFYIVTVSGQDAEEVQREVEGVSAFVAEGDTDVDTATTGPFTRPVPPDSPGPYAYCERCKAQHADPNLHLDEEDPE